MTNSFLNTKTRNKNRRKRKNNVAYLVEIIVDGSYARLYEKQIKTFMFTPSSKKKKDLKHIIKIKIMLC